MGSFLPPERQGIGFDYESPRIAPFSNETQRLSYFDEQWSLLRKHWHEIPWEQWNVGSAKGYPNLAKEIAAGETVLTEEPNRNGDLRLVRNVSTVFVFVVDGKGNWLVEAPQALADGRLRSRRFPYVSETLRFGETPSQAAVRAIREETGGHILATQERFIPGEVHDLTQDHPYNTGSNSYPGLRSNKTAYTFGLVVRGNEKKKVYQEVDEEGTATTHVWKPVAENVWFTPLLRSRIEGSLGHRVNRRRGFPHIFG